jgi:FixJ family two-component response regulator
MTGYGDEKIAVEMMKRGALDYIVKEKDFIDLLISTVKRACTEINNRRKLEQAQKDLRESERQKNLILNSSLELIAYYDTDLQVI